MFYKCQKVGHNDLVIVNDTAPSHDSNTNNGHPASNRIEDMLWTKKSRYMDRQTNINFREIKGNKSGPTKVKMASWS